MFGWLYRLRKHIGTQIVQAYFISEHCKIVPVKKVEYTIRQMADFVEKKKKMFKGGKNVKANPKRQTHNKKEQPDSHKN